MQSKSKGIFPAVPVSTAILASFAFMSGIYNFAIVIGSQLHSKSLENWFDSTNRLVSLFAQYFPPVDHASILMMKAGYSERIPIFTNALTFDWIFLGIYLTLVIPVSVIECLGYRDRLLRNFQILNTPPGYPRAPLILSIFPFLLICMWGIYTGIIGGPYQGLYRSDSQLLFIWFLFSGFGAVSLWALTVAFGLCAWGNKILVQAVTDT
jgi:hypothetical protein